MSDQPLRRVSPESRRGRTMYIRDVPALYLEDIEAIYDVLYEYASSNEREQKEDEYSRDLYGRLGQAWTPQPWVQIETDEYVLDEPADLKRVRREHVPQLTMRPRGFGVRLYCKPSEHSVLTDSETPAEIAAYDRIVGIINKRRSVIVAPIRSPWVLPVASIVVMVSSVVLAGILDEERWLVVGLGLGVLILAFQILWNDLFWPRRRGVVIPRYKVDAPPFWWRTGDTIMAGIIGGVLTALFLALLALIARRL